VDDLGGIVLGIIVRIFWMAILAFACVSVILVVADHYLVVSECGIAPKLLVILKDFWPFFAAIIGVQFIMIFVGLFGGISTVAGMMSGDSPALLIKNIVIVILWVVIVGKALYFLWSPHSI